MVVLESSGEGFNPQTPVNSNPVFIFSNEIHINPYNAQLHERVDWFCEITETPLLSPIYVFELGLRICIISMTHQTRLTFVQKQSTIWVDSCTLKPDDLLSSLMTQRLVIQLFAIYERNTSVTDRDYVYNAPRLTRKCLTPGYTRSDSRS